MIRVYSRNMKLVSILQNAFDISYSEKMNSLGSAEFSLPGDDPKNEDCKAFSYVEIWDGDERVDLYRIMPNSMTKDGSGRINTYKCEHVLATLLDDVLFKYHQTTNLLPADTIEYILSKQTTQNWILGNVDFTDLYSYKWENENLYNALMSIVKPYTEDYMFTWDTSVYPWILNLVRPSNEVSAYIRYKKNLIGITKDEDPTDIVTRYYCLGYGEGDNQLTIESVNGGVPYVDADSETIEKYGIIADFYIDKSEENPAMLKAKAIAALEKAKVPKVVYTVDAAEIYQITKEPIDKFTVGSLVQVYDSESGIEFTARVVGKDKSDIKGNPGDAKLTIANFDTKKISSAVSSIQRRQRVSEVYSQGATNIDSNDYQDNCDATHPAVIEFYIPEECVRVNKCLLSYKVEKFRTYARSNISNPASTITSESGGSSIMSSGGQLWSVRPGYTSGMPVTDRALRDTPYEHAHQIVDIDHMHNVEVPAHTHDVVMPSHTHDIEHGIFEYEYLPEDVLIKVDGNVIPASGLSGKDIDIVPYLSATDGKIQRGIFHKVEIFPGVTEQNPLGLARITATVVKQIFTQSRGGGDY